MMGSRVMAKGDDGNKSSDGSMSIKTENITEIEEDCFSVPHIDLSGGDNSAEKIMINSSSNNTRNVERSSITF